MERLGRGLGIALQAMVLGTLLAAAIVKLVAMAGGGKTFVYQTY